MPIVRKTTIERSNGIYSSVTALMVRKLRVTNAAACGSLKGWQQCCGIGVDGPTRETITNSFWVHISIFAQQKSNEASNVGTSHTSTSECPVAVDIIIGRRANVLTWSRNIGFSDALESLERNCGRWS